MNGLMSEKALLALRLAVSSLWILSSLLKPTQNRVSSAYRWHGIPIIFRIGDRKDMRHDKRSSCLFYLLTQHTQCIALISSFAVILCSRLCLVFEFQFNSFLDNDAA